MTDATEAPGKPKAAMRKWTTRLLIAACVILVALAPFVVAETFRPDGAIHGWLFRQSYARAADKGAVLRRYAEELDGRHTPEASDVFLVSRYQAATTDSERDAILDFYIHQANRCRENAGFFVLAPEFVAHIIRRLPSMPVREQRGALILVEDMRLGRQLYKPKLRGRSLDENDAIRAAAAFYIAWWDSQVPWEKLKEVDPLSGTGLKWGEP